MDTLSHGLWAYALMYFVNKPYAWLAFLFGIFPDLITFGPLLIYRIITVGFHFGKPDVNAISNYIFVVYNITHSLVVFLLTAFIAYLLFNQIPWYMAGWLLHILIDIPLHTKEFFPVKFLYPLSGFYIDGISWGSLWYVLINFSLLIIAYGFIIYNKYFRLR